jgi:uncharacterized protein (DUF362 family)
MQSAIVDFYSYQESIAAALDAINAGETLARQTAILLKPNLINASPHPVTTPADCCESVIEYARSCSDLLKLDWRQIPHLAWDNLQESGT